MTNVVIGCKLPHGLVMEIVEPGKDDTGKFGTMPGPVGTRVTLNGAHSVPRSKGALGEYPSLKVYPYGLTVVDEAFWKAWHARHKDFSFVKDGLVFVAADQKAAMAMAKERVGSVSTGLEPLSPAADDKSKGDKRLSTVADPSMTAAMRQNEQDVPAAA